MEYVQHQSFANRLDDGFLDIGAYEFGTSVSVDELDLEQAITIHPNPSRNWIQIEAGSNTIEKYSLFDQQGRSLINGQAKEVDISALNAGIYFLNIYLKNGRSTVKKFIKN